MDLSTVLPLPSTATPQHKQIYEKNVALYNAAWANRTALPSGMLMVTTIYPKDVLKTMDIQRFVTHYPYDKMWFRMAHGRIRTLCLTFFGMGVQTAASPPAHEQCGGELVELADVPL